MNCTNFVKRLGDGNVTYALEKQPVDGSGCLCFVRARSVRPWPFIFQCRDSTATFLPDLIVAHFEHCPLRCMSFAFELSPPHPGRLSDLREILQNGGSRSY